MSVYSTKRRGCLLQWNECSRLLVNAILYYNMIMLSQAVTRREQRGDTTGATQLTAVSPMAWTHVNFYWRYTFSEEPVDGALMSLWRPWRSIRSVLRHL